MATLPAAVERTAPRPEAVWLHLRDRELFMDDAIAELDRLRDEAANAVSGADDEAEDAEIRGVAIEGDVGAVRIDVVSQPAAEGIAGVPADVGVEIGADIEQVKDRQAKLPIARGESFDLVGQESVMSGVGDAEFAKLDGPPQ